MSLFQSNLRKQIRNLPNQPGGIGSWILLTAFSFFVVRKSVAWLGFLHFFPVRWRRGKNRDQIGPYISNQTGFQLEPRKRVFDCRIKKCRPYQYLDDLFKSIFSRRTFGGRSFWRTNRASGCLMVESKKCRPYQYLSVDLLCLADFGILGLWFRMFVGNQIKHSNYDSCYTLALYFRFSLHISSLDWINVTVTIKVKKIEADFCK